MAVDHLKGFRLTLSFLTLLDKGFIGTEKDLQASWLYFFPVSFILGVLAGLPYLFAWDRDLQALGTLILLVSLSRALHWDGFGDILDGIGSNKQKEHFFQILKDSRLGIFATLGIALGLLTEYVLLSKVGSLSTTIAVVVFSRLQLAFFAYLSKSLARTSGMGQFFLQGASPKILFLNFSLCLLTTSLLINFQTYLLATLIHLIPTFYLYNLGKKHQGINGDFLGANIILGEISFLLALSLH